MKRHTFKSVQTWLEQFHNDEGPRYALERVKCKGYPWRKYDLLRRHSCRRACQTLGEVVAIVEMANAPLAV
jgi:hypothetical protein